jgi:hypothetical protein
MTMTVAELIEQLREHPADLPVYVSGYEGDVNDLTLVRPVRVERNVNTAPDYGRHHVLEDDEPGGTPGLKLV